MRVRMSRVRKFIKGETADCGLLGFFGFLRFSSSFRNCHRTPEMRRKRGIFGIRDPMGSTMDARIPTVLPRLPPYSLFPHRTSKIFGILIVLPWYLQFRESAVSPLKFILWKKSTNYVYISCQYKMQLDNGFIWHIHTGVTFLALVNCTMYRYYLYIISNQ